MKLPLLLEHWERRSEELDIAREVADRELGRLAVLLSGEVQLPLFELVEIKNA